MKNTLFLSLAALLALSGCATTGFNSGTGYAAITDFKEGVMATSANGNKTGTACATNILGFYASGDASIESAKKAGGINAVASVDRHFNNILGFYGKMCTIVKGN
jgi:hypothetical protein